MPYKLSDLRRLGFYEEKTDSKECELEGGKVITELPVSQRIKDLLSTIGGNSYGGDPSRQDSAIITSLLSSGINPADTYATFCASLRGRNARERKAGHFEDYMKRTIERAAAFVEKNPGSGKVKVDFAKQKVIHTSEGLVVSMSHEVETEKTHWIWPSYIPAGKLTIVAGDPGMGKSTIIGDIVARISKGTFLPSGQRSITGSSLIISAEDSAEDTIVPRLIAAGANLKKVGIIRESRKHEGEDESRYLSLPRDLELLRNTIVSTGCRLLVIDPLTAFIEKGADSYKDQDMRRILHPVEAIAQETGCAIIIIAHFNKKEEGNTMYRVSGSIGFVAAARSVLSVTRTAEDVKVLFSLKSNLARRPLAMSYEIRDVRKRKQNPTDWSGEEVINSSAIRWLGEVDFDPFSKVNSSTPDNVALGEATAFLQQVLRDGIVEVEEVFKQAKDAGISKAYVNKAKSNMGILPLKQSGKWHWQLPETGN